MTVETVSAFVDADAPTVAGEVFVDERSAADAPERGAAVAPVRTNDGLSATVVDGRRSRPRRRAGRDRARAAGSRTRRRRPLRLRGRRDEQPAAAARRAMTPRALRRGRTTQRRRSRPDTKRRGPAPRPGWAPSPRVSRAFGFLRVLVIAAVLGTTYLGNAFQAANSVSNVLFELVAAGALSAVLVPTFVQLLDKGDDAEANRLASGLLGDRARRARRRHRRRHRRRTAARAPADRRRRERRGRRAATGARDVPAALVPAAAAALRVRRDRDRRALRAPAVRDHRRGADRQHRRDGRRAHRVPRRRGSRTDARARRPPSGCCW